MYICPFLLEFPSHLLPIPTPLGYDRARLSSLSHIANSHWLFTYVSVYASMLLSPFITSSPSSPLSLSISLFPKFMSPLLLFEQIRQYHPSRFHIHTLIHDFVFLFLTYFTRIVGSRFIHLIRTDSNAFLFVAE